MPQMKLVNGAIVYEGTTKLPSIPQVPLSGDPAQKRFNDAVRQALTSMYTGSGRFATAAEVPGLVTVPPPDDTIPSAPFGLTADGAFQNIILAWDYVDSDLIAYTRIFRNTVDDWETASVLANTEGKVWADNVGSDVGFYYWVATVSTAGVQSPPNATAGTYAHTEPDVNYILNQLQGEILESSLAQDLQARIDLIDADAGTPGSVAQRIAVETNARIQALTDEALARTTADQSNANDFQSLAAQVRGTYTGTDLTQVTTGLIAQERDARVTQGDALAQQISLLTAGVAGGFDPFQTWYFDGGQDGWTGSAANVTYDSGTIIVDGTGGSPGVQLLNNLNPGVNGGQYNVVKARVKRTAGTGWTGILRWRTSGHDFNGTNQLVTDTPAPDVGEWTVLEWNVQDITDWASSTILNMQVLLGADASDDFIVDWIAVGRNGPAASVASLLAEQQARATADSAEISARETLSAKLTGTVDPGGQTIDTLSSGLIYDEKTARVAADGAMVTRVDQLQAGYDGQFASIQTQQTATANALGQVQAQWTLKLDANGRVAGIGVMTSNTTGSQIQMLADKFAIIIPGYNGNKPVVPFIVTTVNGVATVGISSAMIGDAAIVNAKIANAAIDSAKVASLDAAKISFGSMSGARIAVGTLDANAIMTNTLVAKLAAITDAYIQNANIENLTVGGEKFQPNAVSNAAFMSIPSAGSGGNFALNTWVDWDTSISGGSSSATGSGTGGSGGGGAGGTRIGAGGGGVAIS